MMKFSPNNTFGPSKEDIDYRVADSRSQVNDSQDCLEVINIRQTLLVEAALMASIEKNELL